MTIEDRLRSHLRSGDDLFVETGRDAGAIATAGRRRTRRNQIGGAAAGGLLAFALVFGVMSRADNESDEFVSESLVQAEVPEAEMSEAETSEAESSAMADDGAADSQDFGGELMESEDFEESLLAPDFVGYEVIAGVGDGFAGLRTTEDGIVAIRSGDGLDFSDEPTAGLPDGAEITTLVHRNGVFAAPFSVFDERAGQTRSYIGTSTDLTNWTVELVDLGDDFSDLFLGEVALVDDGVVAVVMASPPFDEDAVSLPEPSIFTIGGPVGGPYAAEPLSATGFGVTQLRAAGESAMFTVSTESGADIWALADGVWTVVRQWPIEDFPTLASSADGIYLISSSGIERSNDGGRVWNQIVVPPILDGRSSNANAVASASNVAVLFGLTDDVGMNVGYVLAVGEGDALGEVSLDGLVADQAFVNLVAVSDDEVLIEVFPEPDELDEDAGAADFEPRYVRVPLG